MSHCAHVARVLLCVSTYHHPPSFQMRYLFIWLCFVATVAASNMDLASYNMNKHMSQCPARGKCNLCVDTFEDADPKWYDLTKLKNSQTLEHALELAWCRPARGFDKVILAKHPLFTSQYLSDDMVTKAIKAFTTFWLELLKLKTCSLNSSDKASAIMALPQPRYPLYPVEQVMWALEFDADYIKQVIRQTALKKGVAHYSDLLYLKNPDITAILVRAFHKWEARAKSQEQVFEFYSKLRMHLQILQPSSSILIYALQRRAFKFALAGLTEEVLDSHFVEFVSILSDFEVKDDNGNRLQPQEAAELLQNANFDLNQQDYCSKIEFEVNGQVYVRQSRLLSFLNRSLDNLKAINNSYLVFVLLLKMCGKLEEDALRLMLNERLLHNAIGILLSLMRHGIFDKDVALTAVEINPAAAAAASIIFRYALLFQHNLASEKTWRLIQAVIESYLLPTATPQGAQHVVRELVLDENTSCAMLYAIEYCAVFRVNLAVFLNQCQVTFTSMSRNDWRHVAALCAAVYAPLHASGRCLCDIASEMLPHNKRKKYHTQAKSMRLKVDV